MMTEETFDIDYWLDEVYKSIKGKSNQKLIVGFIAKSFNLDPDDVAQEVATWLWKDQHLFNKPDLTDHYIVRSINNRAKKVCQKAQTEQYLDEDRYVYAKDFVRKARFDLMDNMNLHPDSDANAIRLDFARAVSTLNEKELDAFMSEPGDDVEDKDRTARSRAITKVWKRMNGFADDRVIRPTKYMEEY